MSTDTLAADRIEIADLFTRFALLLDEKRWEDADTVFTADVAVHSPRGGELHGIDKVVGFMRQGEVEGQHAQHTTTDLLVDVDGDQAANSRAPGRFAATRTPAFAETSRVQPHGRALAPPEVLGRLRWTRPVSLAPVT